MKLLGVRPRRAIDGEHVGRFLARLSGSGSPKTEITNTLSAGDPSRGSTTIAPPSWVSRRCRVLHRSGSGRGPIEIGAGSVQLESDLLRRAGSDRHRIAAARSRAEAIDAQRRPQCVPQREHDGRSFANPDEWSGHGEVSAFFTERGDFNGRTLRPCRDANCLTSAYNRTFSTFSSSRRPDACCR